MPLLSVCFVSVHIPVVYLVSIQYLALKYTLPMASLRLVFQTDSLGVGNQGQVYRLPTPILQCSRLTVDGVLYLHSVQVQAPATPAGGSSTFEWRSTGVSMFVSGIRIWLRHVARTYVRTTVLFRPPPMVETVQYMDQDLHTQICPIQTRILRTL